MPQMWPMHWELVSLASVTIMLLMGGKSNFFKTGVGQSKTPPLLNQKVISMNMLW